MIYFAFLFFIFSVFSSTFAEVASVTEPASETVQGFAGKVFKNYKEYASPGFFSGSPLIKRDQFDGLVKKFNSKMKLQLGKINGKPYAQKIKVPSKSKVCFMGDIHGSIHSLMRNLLRLIYLGFLGDDFKIKKDTFYMVFTGDYINRGRYSIEVVFTILLLKLFNFDNVFLLRGNHETIDISASARFYTEQNIKFGENYDRISDFFDPLAYVLFIASGTRDSLSWIQCCHGGIEPTFNPREFLKSDQQFFDLSNVLQSYKPYSAEVLVDIVTRFKSTFSNTLVHNGYLWCDFFDSGWKGFDYKDRRGYVIGIREILFKFLNDFGLEAVFRGHQHFSYGLKIGGEQHWRNFVNKKDNADGFLMKNIDYPVFTLSTAAEGVGLPYDCFVILTTADSVQGWRIRPYEFVLPTNRDNKFVSVKKNEGWTPASEDDLLNIEWTAAK